MFRGLALPIKDASTVEAILIQGGLNWEVCEAPVLYRMPGAANPNAVESMPSRKVLVRCDTGVPLEVVSETFKVHQNPTIVGSLKALADRAGVVVDAAGCMAGGARIFLSGYVDRKFDAAKGNTNPGHDFTPGAASRTGAKVGDIVQLRFIISGGHKPGTPTTIKAQAMRLVCTNGATVGGRECSVRVSHQQKLDGDSLRRLEAFLSSVTDEFTAYEEKAVRLMGTPIPYEVNQAFVLELLQADLLEKVVRDHAVVRPGQAHLSGHEILAEVLERRERGLLRPMQLADNSGELGRTVKDVISVFNTQPGADLAGNTMWNAYNAVTYHVDHVRGRSTDASVESALFGDGDRLKNSALDLAVEYTERLRTLGVA
jgi:hypothetical protein